MSADPPRVHRAFRALGRPIDWIRRSLSPSEWEPLHTLNADVQPVFDVFGTEWFNNEKVTFAKGTATSVANNFAHTMYSAPAGVDWKNEYVLIVGAGAGEATDNNMRLQFVKWTGVAGFNTTLRPIESGYNIQDMSFIALHKPVVMYENENFGVMETDLGAGLTIPFNTAWIVCKKGEPLPHVGQVHIC